jgi:cytoskeletal protein CcmA (bactofilin family)
MSEERSDTIISDDIVFRGTLKFQDSLRVKGHIKGNIEANGELLIDDTGKVDADVLVNTLIVNGSLKGNIEAKEKIEIGKTGVVVGDIKSPILQVETGAKFTGNCSM